MAQSLFYTGARNITLEERENTLFWRRAGGEVNLLEPWRAVLFLRPLFVDDFWDTLLATRKDV